METITKECVGGGNDKAGGWRQQASCKGSFETGDLEQLKEGDVGQLGEEEEKDSMFFC